MSASILKITGLVRDYAWGTPGGVSTAFGRVAGDAPEAELWLGAHPSAPSEIVDASPWADLADWESATGRRVPYLLKLLSAASPLSLQAHPTPDQAAEGFARENALGIALDARERNYKDPYAKPELIVALFDGFEALCGFRPVDETLAVVRELAALASDPAPFAAWEQKLGEGLAASFAWLLDGGPVVEALASEITAVAASRTDRFELPHRIAGEYPGDPGIAVALMLNHVTLAAGESLWLPAGNIHAYLRGTGVELMGPSDNVLRGGLTPKHVDVPELNTVLDFTAGPPPFLPALPVADGVVTYRPRSQESGAGVDFELYAVTADASLTTGGPAIALVTDGAFTLSTEGSELALQRGETAFVTDASTLSIAGSGRLFLATV